MIVKYRREALSMLSANGTCLRAARKLGWHFW